MEVGLVIISLFELVAVYLIWRLWDGHVRRSWAFRIGWSLLLLIPVLGIIFYGLAVNDPPEKPGWGSENNQGWGDP